jgi:DNA-binding NarL/FixJ family response regulator
MLKKILFAEDHPLLRRSVKAICDALGVTELAEVESCNGLLKELKKGDYTHLILDLTLSDGSALQILPAIRNLYPRLRILVFSVQPAFYGESLKRQYKVQYYVSKATPEPDAIRILKYFIENRIPMEQSTSTKEENPFSELSRREKEILHLLLMGLSPKEVAEELHMDAGHVRMTKHRIMEKTKASNIIELKELASIYKII